MFPPNFYKAKSVFFIKLLFCLAFAAFVSACEPSPSMMTDVNSPSAVNNNAAANDNLTSLEREIRDMKVVEFRFIYVFKRRDGGVFTREDKQYIKANSPAETNRFTVTDDEKAIIAGSHFNFSPENLEMLQKRFIMEDYSVKPPTVNSANQTPSR